MNRFVRIAAIAFCAFEILWTVAYFTVPDFAYIRVTVNDGYSLTDYHGPPYGLYWRIQISFMLGFLAFFFMDWVRSVRTGTPGLLDPPPAPFETPNRPDK